MNQVSIVQTLNPFSGERYTKLAIDGKPLDELLHEHYPQHNLLDMVPTLLPWLGDETERSVVWSRILPAGPDMVLSPILMCGEDMDFWCAIIVAETQRVNDTVVWHRLGIDHTDDRGFHPEHVGTNVEWLDRIGPFVFQNDQFAECVEELRKRLNPAPLLQR